MDLDDNRAALELLDEAEGIDLPRFGIETVNRRTRTLTGLALNVLSPYDEAAEMAERWKESILDEKDPIEREKLRRQAYSEIATHLEQRGIGAHARLNMVIRADSKLKPFVQLDELYAECDPEAVLTLPKREREYGPEDILQADEAKLSAMYAENRLETIRRYAFRQRVSQTLTTASKEGDVWFAQPERIPSESTKEQSTYFLNQLRELKQNDPENKAEFLRLVQVESLRELAFHSDESNDFNRFELMELFNRFRLLNAPAEQEALLQSHAGKREKRFSESPIAREFHAFALIKQGKSAEAIEAVTELYEGNPALVQGAIGDARSQQRSIVDGMIAATQAVEQARGTEGEKAATVTLNALQGRFVEAFSEKGGAPYEAPEDTEKLRALRAGATHLQKEAYEKGFTETGASYPGSSYLRTTLIESGYLQEERARLESKGTLSNDQSERLAEVTAEIERNKRIASKMHKLVAQATEAEGGSYAQDYWLHSSMVENLCVESVETGEAAGDLQAVLARAFSKVDVPWKLEKTRGNLAAVRTAYIALGKAQPDLATLDAAIAGYDAEILRFKRENKPLGKPQGASYEDDPEGFFREHTYSARGLINSTIPQYIPGGTYFGARVPDYINGRKDEELFGEKLEEWGIVALYKEGKGTLRERLVQTREALQQRLREELKTYELMSLKAKLHASFDKASEKQIKFSGISGKYNRALTNVFVVLKTKIADCRENAKLYALGYAKFQRMIADALLAEQFARLEQDDGTDEAAYAETEKEIDAFLGEDVLIADYAIYVDAQVNGKYDAVGPGTDSAYDPEHPELIQRNYGLEQYAAREPVSDYELTQSIVRIEYDDGTVQMIGRKKGEKKLPHQFRPEDEKPCLNLTFAEGKTMKSLQLLQRVEDHTATVLKTSTGFEHNDVFYKHTDKRKDPEQSSPYELGEGAINPEELRRTGYVSVGATVVDASGQRVPEAKAYLTFTEYTGGVDKARISYGTTGDELRSHGIPLKDGTPEELDRYQAAVEKLKGWTPPSTIDIAKIVQRLRPATAA